MDQGLLTVLAAAGVVVLVLLLVVLVSLLRTGRRTRAELAASRADLAGLRDEVDELRSAAARAEVEPVPAREQEFVITTLPDGTTRAAAAVPDDDDRLPVRQLTAGEFASVAVGESMVRLVSLGYGVRRALSAENRNRIRFEMRREVKRSRKQRRRDLKEAKRHLRAEPHDLDRDAA